jgi:hypothetical protein
MKAPREIDIVNACLTLLQLRKVFAWRVNSGAVTFEKGHKRYFVQFARGAKGISDIIGLLPGGRFLAVEVKRPGNKPSADQECFLAQIQASGGLGIVVTSPTELDKAIEDALKGMI